MNQKLRQKYYVPCFVVMVAATLYGCPVKVTGPTVEGALNGQGSNPSRYVYVSPLHIRNSNGMVAAVFDSRTGTLHTWSSEHNRRQWPIPSPDPELFDGRFEFVSWEGTYRSDINFAVVDSVTGRFSVYDTGSRLIHFTMP